MIMDVTGEYLKKQNNQLQRVSRPQIGGKYFLSKSQRGVYKVLNQIDDEKVLVLALHLPGSTPRQVKRQILNLTSTLTEEQAQALARQLQDRD